MLQGYIWALQSPVSYTHLDVYKRQYYGYDSCTGLYMLQCVFYNICAETIFRIHHAIMVLLGIAYRIWYLLDDDGEAYTRKHALYHTIRKVIGYHARLQYTQYLSLIHI